MPGHYHSVYKQVSDHVMISYKTMRGEYVCIFNLCHLTLFILNQLQITEATATSLD